MNYFSQRNIQIAGLFVFLLFIYCNYDGSSDVKQSDIIIEYREVLAPHVQKVERLLTEYDQMASGPEYKLIAYLKRVIPQVREEITALEGIQLEAKELQRVRQQMIDSLEATGKFLDLSGQFVTKKRGIHQAEVTRARDLSKRRVQSYIQTRDRLLKQYDQTQRP